MDDYTPARRTDPAMMWAIVAMMAIVTILLFGGFGVAYGLGGITWARGYGIAVGILLVLGVMFGAVYAIMHLLVGHALGLQRSNADLLHAHSMSGAQQARAVTEVIRGANAINKADAATQQEMIRGFGRIGQEYERQLAKMAGRAIEAEQRAALPPPAADDGMPQYLLPADGEPVVYRLPEVR